MEREIAEFLGSAPGKLAPATVEAYGRELRRFAAFLAERGLAGGAAEVSRTTALAYALWLSEAMAPASAARAISALKTFYGHLLRQGAITQDPTEDVKPPSVRHESAHDAPPKREAANNTRDRAILALLNAGVKPGELANMTPGDVNIAGGYVRVRSDKRQANIALGAALADVKEYCAARGIPPDDKLFGLTRQGIWKIVKRYAEVTGDGD